MKSSMRFPRAIFWSPNDFYIKGICRRLKMSEPGCALPFTSGPHKATHLSMCDRTCYGSDLVAKTLSSDLVGVQSCATAACNCTNKPASLTPHNAADYRPCRC